ncbi:MAG: PilN domain-containing protein, partial [Candidatus Omnitrophica bacterium]|nr:PilN domain-containing protein [Candidatus Omnitrophota bacterium]
SASDKQVQQLALLIIPAVFLILILTHIYFLFTGLIGGIQLNSLKTRWDNASVERKALDEFNAEYLFISADAKDIQKFLSERINWSEKLNKLSLSLPEGIWLEHISATGKDFYLKGKAVSLDKSEVSLIRNYVEGIKGQPQFIKNFSSLEITSIQKATKGSYEVADFSLTGSFK